MARACDDAKRNSQWGATMLRRRGWLRQQALYPGLTQLWRLNAIRTRWGLPLLPVPDLTGIARYPRSPERKEKLRKAKAAAKAATTHRETPSAER